MRGDLCLKISAGGDEMPSNWNIGDVWAGRDQGPGWARTLESDKCDVSREMLCCVSDGSAHWCFKKFHPKVRNHGEGPY